MELKLYTEIKNRLIQLGYQEEIDWQTNLQPCANHLDFYAEVIWVILNSGMREQIARVIKDRIYLALAQGKDIATVFKHTGKVHAIKYVLKNSERLFDGYKLAVDKIEYLQTIPYIGKITCYHLAKNLGHDCVKPDRHLVRVAKEYGTDPDSLCEQISKESGDKKCVIDIVLWRACNLKLL